jgi:tetratricopeptide (TPR) repeat protein
MGKPGDEAPENDVIDKTPEDRKSLEFEEVVKLQNQMLERLANHLAPETQEKLLTRVIGKIIALVTILSGVVLGSYEFVGWYSDLLEQRALEAKQQQIFDNYLEVARSTYEEEQNAMIALQVLANAESMEPQDPDLVQLKAYIEGMETVELLLNLDRPFMQEEVDQAAYAMSQATMLVQVAPEIADGYILKGQLYSSLDQLDRAKTQIDQAIALEPDNSFAWVRRGLLQWKTYVGTGLEQNITNAIDSLNMAKKLDPTSKWPPLWLGVIEFEVNGDDEAAMKYYQDALEIDPRFTMAMENVAHIHNLYSEYPELEEQVWRALKLKPDNVRAWTLLAESLGWQKSYRPALVYAQRATETDSNSFYAWMMRGRLAFEVWKERRVETGLEDREMAEQAVEAYGRAIALKPTSSDAYLQRSWVLLEMGETSLAGDDVRQAVKVDPSNPGAFLALADYQKALGLLEECIVSYARTAELTAEDPDARSLMDEAMLAKAMALVSLDRTEDAAATFKEASSDPGLDFAAEIHTEHGNFKRLQDDPAGALACYALAQEQDPEFFEAWAAEARLMLDQGDPDGAREAINQCLQLAPQSEMTRELQDRASQLAAPAAP